MEKIVAKGEFGFLTIMRPLQRSDFSEAVVRKDGQSLHTNKSASWKHRGNSYGAYVDAYQEFTFSKDIDLTDMKDFLGSILPDERNGVRTITVTLKHEVETRGTKKENQEAKLDEALATLLKGFSGENLLAERIKSMNDEITAFVARHNERQAATASADVRDPDKYKWTEEYVVTRREKMAKLRAQIEKLREEIREFQKEAIKTYVDTLPAELKEVVAKDLKEKGLVSRSLFGG
jgi:ribosomal protein L24E